MMIPDTLAPTVPGRDASVVPAICRVSRDLTQLAFWAPDATPPGLFVSKTEEGSLMSEEARRVWSGADGQSLSALAWSGDGQYLAFVLSTGAAPGELSVLVVRLSNLEVTRLTGHAFAWAGNGATLLIADPASSRLYIKDLDLDIEHRVSEIADDGDPQFPPVISLSPDVQRLAVVTRQVSDNVTRVQMAHHDGRAWETHPLSEMPGVSTRILPFWSADSRAFALYVIDMEQHHSAIIGVPRHEGEGDVLYTSDSVDAAIVPAPHPDGRFVAFVRSHPKEAASTLLENRLVLLDPVEHTVAPITNDAEIVGNLRWLNAQTLLVEGGPAVWTVKLRTIEEAAKREVEPSPGEGFVRTVVRDIEPAFTFACEIPEGWQRLPLPPDPVDFTDPRVMRPLCVFTPSYAAIVFTVATRPAIPGRTPAEALADLSAAQDLKIDPVQDVSLPCGEGAQTMATQRAGNDLMKMRLAMIEDGGHLFSITAMAPAPLWDAMQPTLDHIVESFVLLDPKGPGGSAENYEPDGSSSMGEDDVQNVDDEE